MWIPCGCLLREFLPRWPSARVDRIWTREFRVPSTTLARDHQPVIIQTEIDLPLPYIAPLCGCFLVRMHARIHACSPGLLTRMPAHVEACSCGCLLTRLTAHENGCSRGCLLTWALLSWVSSRLNAYSCGCQLMWLSAYVDICSCECLLTWIPPHEDSCSNGCGCLFVCAFASRAFTWTPALVNTCSFGCHLYQAVVVCKDQDFNLRTSDFQEKVLSNTLARGHQSIIVLVEVWPEIVPYRPLM